MTDKLTEAAREHYLQMNKAFGDAMGDPTMPDDSSPEYDEWLFSKAYEAGLQALSSPTPSDDHAECHQLWREERERLIDTGHTATQLALAHDMYFAGWQARGQSRQVPQTGRK